MARYKQDRRERRRRRNHTRSRSPIDDRDRETKERSSFEEDFLASWDTTEPFYLSRTPRSLARCYKIFGLNHDATLADLSDATEYWRRPRNEQTWGDLPENRPGPEFTHARDSVELAIYEALPGLPVLASTTARAPNARPPPPPPQYMVPAMAQTAPLVLPPNMWRNPVTGAINYNAYRYVGPWAQAPPPPPPGSPPPPPPPPGAPPLPPPGPPPGGW